MEYMSGEKQRIFAGELFGAKWKIKEGLMIIDLKVMRTLEPIMGKSFIEHWGYIRRLSKSTETESLYIAAVTEEPTDLEVIHVPQYTMDEALAYVKRRMPRFIAVKKNE